MSELSGLLEIAKQAAELAQREILAVARRGFQVETKSDLTPVTEADRAAERVVREFLAKETPNFGMVGEEYGRSLPDAEWQWILDPIDGTKAFARGVPLYGTLLALWQGDRNRVGIIRLPAMDSCLWAADGLGAFVDGVPAKVSATASLSEALVVAGTVNTMDEKGWGEGFTRLRKSALLHRGWGDCYGYYMVATGKAEVMLDPIVSLWDIAPFPVIFREAGGEFSLLDGSHNLPGEPGKLPGDGPFNAMASNGILHSPAMNHLHNR